jgi:hypothetical protein
MEAVWIGERVDLLNDSGRQWIFRPSGPTVDLQAQRAGTMDAGGRSPPVAEPPNSSSGPAGRQGFFRPNGPAQWMPGDEVPRLQSPPTLLQAQRADRVMFFPSSDHLEKMTMSALRAFPNRGCQ